MTEVASHGTTSGWRTGCRQPGCGCRTAHNADTTERRRAQTDELLPPAVRRRLLKLLRNGVRLADAAATLGITQQAVWGRSRRDPAWREELDLALIAGRDPDVRHGTAAGYRYYGCGCPQCRRAHRGGPATTEPVPAPVPREDELTLPRPVERALDLLEEHGWQTAWREEGKTKIQVHATRGRWRLRTAFHRPPIGARGGWKAGNLAVSEVSGPRVRRVNRRSLPAIAEAGDEQLDRLLSGGGTAVVRRSAGLG